MWQYNYGPELAHHGIKGMKWGVRRYQNYDGSYTKKGLERYNKAESDYESAKAKQKQIKSDHKKGTATKQDVKKANQDVKSAKKKMSDAYGGLKTDKLADEGEELYRKGKTITGNTNISAITQNAIVIGSRVDEPTYRFVNWRSKACYYHNDSHCGWGDCRQRDSGRNRIPAKQTVASLLRSLRR